MKTNANIIIVASVLALALTTQAQTVIGSWQNNTGDGWIDNGNGLSITNAANTNKYQFVKGVVTGYAQSLEINQAGFNQSLEIDLNSIPGGKAAFLANNKLSFTVSFPPASESGATAGYSQIYSFTVNCSGLYTNIPWSNWTGNGGNMPGVGYYSSFAGQSITVTWDYSSFLTNAAVTAALTNNSYFQLSFTGNNGGGAPTNFYMNNVVLSGATSPQIIVDQFNPANNPYAGTNDYDLGYITNVYGINWFGSALTNYPNPVWDPTMDANGDTNSGSMKITAVFNGGGQWVIHDKGPSFSYAGINPPITNGLSLLTFECDVHYDPSSPTWFDGTTNTFGRLEFGTVPPYSPTVFGYVDVPTNSTGWVHVTIPLNPQQNTNLLNISGIFIKQDGASYGALNGTSTLWVDNLKFTYTNTPPLIPPPTLSMEKAVPGLRIFAGSTANTYDREELATVDQNQSWVGGSYPVSYSFKLLSYPSSINQTHIFLVPVNTSGQANMGNNGTANEYIEYQASNTLWMIINPANNGVTASVQWKTNRPNANPNITALTITNSTAVGTWTLTFTSNSSGTLTAPGASPVPFTIDDPNVASDFANPLIAYFGIQPNSTSGEGQYEDWASISVSGVAGTQESEDFTSESSFNPNGYWANNSAQASSIQLVTTNTPYWISWTLPAINYGLGTASSVLGSMTTLYGSQYPWVLPEYFNSYNDGNIIPGQSTQGKKTWVLIPTTCLPTVDGSQGGTPAPSAYFRLFNPPLEN